MAVTENVTLAPALTVAPTGWTPPPVGSEAGFSFRYPGVFAA